jgi:predicted component of type VI protein secretion system
MKLSLVVLAPEKMRGRVIPVSRSPFLIGRDPECYLRPSSSTVSLRHCAIRLREGRVSIEDLDSTNGTLVNERRIKGEIELLNGDRLTIGPLVLELRLQVGTPVTEATPLPPTKSSSEASDDEAAAVLLSTDGQDNSPALHGAKPRFPLGDTEIIHLPPAENLTPAPRSDGLPFGSSGVAKELLKQYRRRARPDK